MGYTFVWVAGCQPYFVSPSAILIPCSVVNAVPILDTSRCSPRPIGDGIVHDPALGTEITIHHRSGGNVIGMNLYMTPVQITPLAGDDIMTDDLTRPLALPSVDRLGKSTQKATADVKRGGRQPSEKSPPLTSDVNLIVDDWIQTHQGTVWVRRHHIERRCLFTLVGVRDGPVGDYLFLCDSLSCDTSTPMSMMLLVLHPWQAV